MCSKGAFGEPAQCHLEVRIEIKGLAAPLCRTPRIRAALEAREMANAIQAIAERFAMPEEAAQHFGRSQLNLSEKVIALLDSGKISSTCAAIQLEKLSKKNEAKAESFIEQIEQMHPRRFC